MKEVIQDSQNTKDNNFINSNKSDISNYDEKNKEQSDTQINEVFNFNCDDKGLILEEALNEIDYCTFYS